MSIFALDGPLNLRGIYREKGGKETGEKQGIVLAPDPIYIVFVDPVVVGIPS